ncbi:7,8-didemethyl-8-hydroxy-5-deazariboflavin synthase subunit CofG [Stenomitos frigidus]|uniref:7,8-didemethyl-8-hydroxy-5-deazariboflavin synthase n=1 Tax=Stenomitos frigidus ULC18 TaxID=2107698 RepID=A0A2T1EGJ1_9CYAN|nr:7,8-didemethyl-8-hydroxy-5-deazariboflavin synthase subunit CofG [Stenomitos frigidus]PSB31823.1 7,8-didemethyl-8-hydroxy-5-deazariboflavin synthase subunit CofG [Stenomitos frigidus ULC18]
MDFAQTATYSPAYTLVPTYECFNRCSYCNFRTDPGKSPWLSLADAESKLRSLQHQGVIEILILSGEVHPQSDRRSLWFQRLYELCALAVSLGFLPHTNAGPLSVAEMSRLKTVNVSMGLMVEQVTPSLLQTVHRHAPSKRPERRLQQLAQAGELQIPFTTGLLLGLGETEADRCETLEAIAQIHQRWRHIQEVILQPYSPGLTETWASAAFSPAQLLETIVVARRILPTDITLQMPPNLVSRSQLLTCLEAGASDLGGIGPRDEVNPDYPHPIEAELANSLALAGWTLVPRLPIYPQYDHWLSPELRGAVDRWRERLGRER